MAPLQDIVMSDEEADEMDSAPRTQVSKATKRRREDSGGESESDGDESDVCNEEEEWGSSGDGVDAMARALEAEEDDEEVIERPADSESDSGDSSGSGDEEEDGSDSGSCRNVFTGERGKGARFTRSVVQKVRKGEALNMLTNFKDQTIGHMHVNLDETPLGAALKQVLDRKWHKLMEWAQSRLAHCSFGRGTDFIFWALLWSKIEKVLSIYLRKSDNLSVVGKRLVVSAMVSGVSSSNGMPAVDPELCCGVKELWWSTMRHTKSKKEVDGEDVVKYVVVNKVICYTSPRDSGYCLYEPNGKELPLGGVFKLSKADLAKGGVMLFKDPLGGVGEGVWTLLVWSFLDTKGAKRGYSPSDANTKHTVMCYVQHVIINRQGGYTQEVFESESGAIHGVLRSTGIKKKVKLTVITGDEMAGDVMLSRSDHPGQRKVCTITLKTEGGASLVVQRVKKTVTKPTRYLDPYRVYQWLRAGCKVAIKPSDPNVDIYAADWAGNVGGLRAFRCLTRYSWNMAGARPTIDKNTGMVSDGVLHDPPLAMLAHTIPTPANETPEACAERVFRINKIQSTMRMAMMGCSVGLPLTEPKNSSRSGFLTWCRKGGLSSRDASLKADSFLRTSPGQQVPPIPIFPGSRVKMEDLKLPMYAVLSCAISVNLGLKDPLAVDPPPFIPPGPVSASSFVTYKSRGMEQHVVHWQLCVQFIGKWVPGTSDIPSVPKTLNWLCDISPDCLSGKFLFRPLPPPVILHPSHLIDCNLFYGT
nr:hypothetical protein [Salmonid herpesvirus 1]